VSKSLYVGNLPWTATEQELSEVFGAHGKVDAARIITDRETGRSKGFGFVEVAEEDVSKVIQAMNGFMLKERALKVNEAQPRAEKGSSFRR
jgi:RNA recognition motif-containing protein